MKRLFSTTALFFLFTASVFAITAEEEQALVDRVFSIFAETSTGLYDSMPPIRTCGTSLLTQLMTQYSELSPRTKAALQQGPFDREPGFDRYDTPSGHFRIHYADTGIHAVRYPTVKVNRGGQLIPVWVDTLAMVLDSIWQKEIVQMGFRAPVPDGFYPEGEDNRFDVYLKGLSSTFLGATVPELTDAPPCDPNIFGPLCNRATAYIILDNDYDTPPYDDPLYGIGPSGGMRVTAAHEFFHAIQFAYNVFGFEVVGGNQLYYWQEATATWMEDQMYNEINDYRQYLPFWFDAPQLSFRSFSDDFGSNPYRAFRPYALAIYGQYLSKRFPNPSYGYSVVRRVWEQMATVTGFNLFSAVDAALAPMGYNFISSLQEFYRWNYFVGGKIPLNAPDTLYGSEAAAWPTFELYDQVDSTSNYPTQHPEVFIPCNQCHPNVIKFFCAPCFVNTVGFPCSTKCPPCRFVPYQPTNVGVINCVNDIEDLGASYLNLQNPGGGSFMEFALVSDTSRAAPWFVSAVGYNTNNRNYTFLANQATDPSGRIPEMFFSDFGNYTEVVVMVTNSELLPAGSVRQNSAYAYSANVDSAAPPAVSSIQDGRPNPFRPEIDKYVKFPIVLDSLSGRWDITLLIFSSSGEIVCKKNWEKDGGFTYRETVVWYGSNRNGDDDKPEGVPLVASGVYFCKIIMKELGTSRKVEKVSKIALIRQ